ncbi:hypothetical protein BKA63DRAFT_494110 [Paraphoma chrysanthemicola]|nr:hypothetical protein BKA63DRAFT_494110 [Paraphoma chrysanthemicola]
MLSDSIWDLRMITRRDGDGGGDGSVHNTAAAGVDRMLPHSYQNLSKMHMSPISKSEPLERLPCEDSCWLCDSSMGCSLWDLAAAELVGVHAQAPLYRNNTTTFSWDGMNQSRLRSVEPQPRLRPGLHDNFNIPESTAPSMCLERLHRHRYRHAGRIAPDQHEDMEREAVWREMDSWERSQEQYIARRVGQRDAIATHLDTPPAPRQLLQKWQLQHELTNEQAASDAFNWACPCE